MLLSGLGEVRGSDGLSEATSKRHQSHCAAFLHNDQPSTRRFAPRLSLHSSQLHVEVTTDRLRREFGVDVKVGEPSVAFKEILEGELGGEEMVKFEREVGGKVIKADIAVKMERVEGKNVDEGYTELVENTVCFGSDAKRFLQMAEGEDGGEEGKEGNEGEEGESEGSGAHEENEEGEGVPELEGEAAGWNECTTGIVEGIKGALQRGPVSGVPLTNVKVTVGDVRTDGGYSDQEAGTLRAAAAHVVGKMLKDAAGKGEVGKIEPVMMVNVSANREAIGAVLSDFSTRGGVIGEVSNIGGDKQGLVGKVPLKKILGYSTKLRSLTAGSGIFTAEYFAHANLVEE